MSNRDAISIEDYSEAIHKAVARAQKQGAGVAIVDGCLYLVAIRSEHISKTGIGAVAHFFLHVANPELPCRLSDPERRREELQLIRSVPRFLDLVAVNMTAAWGTPVFLWASREQIMDLITGRVRLFVQFDLVRFFDLAASEGIQLSWIAEKEAEEFKRLSRRNPGSPDAWGARAKLPDGSEHTILFGMFARATADITSPRELVKLIKQSPEPAEKKPQ